MSSEMQRELGESGPVFDLDVIPDRDRVIVAPSGEIDLSTAPQLQSTLQELMERGFTQVVADLRRVEFLDSQGVRALVNAHNRARELEATFTLVLGDGVGRNVLEMCGLLEHLDVTG